MKNWSLNAKITFLLSILLVGCISIGYVGLSGIKTQGENVSEFSNMFKRSGLVAEIKQQQLQYAVKTRDLVIAKTPEDLKRIQGELGAERERLLALVDDYSKMVGDSGKEMGTKYKEAAEKWLQINGRGEELAMQDKDSEAINVITKDAVPARQAADAILVEINKRTDQLVDDTTTDAQADYAHATRMVLIAGILCLVLGVSLAFFILRSLGQSISRVISELNQSSDKVNGTAQQVAAASEQLSQATSEQAASLQETSSSVEEMNSMVHRNTESAGKAAATSEQSRGSAIKGKQVVDHMIHAIEDINVSNGSIMNQIDRSNAEISEIVKVISEIGNKTKVINDIVFQTKLLSFNASVEAARAGEHGKGFAVVAEEVGNLAQMSGNAAKEIAEMLDGSIKKVDDIVNSTKTSVNRLIAEGKAKVQAGTEIAHECGRVLDEIVANVSEVSRMAGEISTASSEQATGVQEITKAISQLDQVTQQNSATSGEAARASEELAGQAEALKRAIQLLIQEIKGSEKVSGSDAARKTADNVVVLKPKKLASKPVLKKAAGDGFVPAHDDRRFKDL